MAILRNKSSILNAKFSAGVFACVCATLAIAQNAPPKIVNVAPAALAEPIKATLDRKKIVVKSGVETRVDADAVKPGDVIEESVTYANVSDKPIFKFVAQLPVPSNTELIISSPKPSLATASTDGVKYAAIPLKRAVSPQASTNNAAPTSPPTLVPVPLDEYRFLRWAQNEISPGKSMTVSARFRVLGNNLLGNNLLGRNPLVNERNLGQALPFLASTVAANPSEKNHYAANTISALGAKSILSIDANK